MPGQRPARLLCPQGGACDIGSVEVQVSTMTVALQGICAGSQGLLSWTPIEEANLTGYKVYIQNQETDPPEGEIFNVGPTQTSVAFTNLFGPNLVSLFPIISGEASTTPAGWTEFTGYKGPLTMYWEYHGADADSIGSHQATVSFIWSGEFSLFQLTGGLSDTFQVTSSPGNLTEKATLNTSTLLATATFSGIQPGVHYTFSETISNACGTAGPVASGVFTPGQPATLSGTPPQSARKGHRYNYAFTLGGRPLPHPTITEGVLPPGLTLFANGVIAGVPKSLGTYTATVAAGQ